VVLITTQTDLLTYSCWAAVDHSNCMQETNCNYQFVQLQQL